ncbi:MAG: dienelactone hydrolase family protein [Bacteroidetes bacterium]|nr:dienelactone hydrolase family protein [Bacteroidota bacterium]
MQKTKLIFAVLFAVITLFTACNNSGNTESQATIDSNSSLSKEPKWKEENVTYTGDSATMNGFVVYNENDPAKRPAVLVVPEWWGLVEYAKFRARELAKLGYIAMAVDVYGDGKTADNPDSAGKFAMPFYQNPLKAKARINAAIAKIKTYSQTDPSNIAAVGYCFGGGVLLNTVRLGDELKGVVSFHGSLIGTPAKKELLKSKILVCHGAADPFVPKKEVDLFKKQMDSIGAVYTFKEYAGALHAFTNPNATEMGKKFKLPIAYNGAADTASWADMKTFFGELFK